MKPDYHFETLAIHAGQAPDPATGAIMTPIYQTSTYVQSEVGVHKGYEYSRTGNPTRTALEACLAALEGAEFGLAFASGMAATDTLLRLVEPGEHVLVGDDVYGGTYRLFDKVLQTYGLAFSYVDMSDLEAVMAALRPETRLVWLETPTNPLLKVADVAAICTRVREFEPQGAGGGGQHLRHSISAAATGAGRPLRRAQHHQVPGRSLGCGRRGNPDQRCRSLRAAEIPAERHRGGSGTDGLLAGAARPEDAGAAHAAPLRQRPAGGRIPGRPPGSEASVLPRAEG